MHFLIHLSNFLVIQAKGVKDFPPNFIIVNMLDFVAVKNSDKKPILCSSCNEQLPATARCIDCMDFLCYACHSAHGRVRITKDHQVNMTAHLITFV